MRIELSPFVEGDLDGIAEYIADDNPVRAASFVREIRAKFREIGQGPLLFQLRPEIGEGARMALVGRYAILFQVVGDLVRMPLMLSEHAPHSSRRWLCSDYH